MGRVSYRAAGLAPRLWDVATGALLRTFVGHPRKVYSVAFSPDGQQRAVRQRGQDDEVVGGTRPPGLSCAPSRGIPAGSGRLRSRLTAPGVLSHSWDNTMKLWDAAGGGLVRTFQKQTHFITSVAFSPDGARVLSVGSNDTTTRILDAETGAQLAALIGGRDGEWIAITPAGFFAASRKGHRDAWPSCAEKTSQLSIRCTSRCSIPTWCASARRRPERRGARGRQGDQPGKIPRQRAGAQMLRSCRLRRQRSAGDLVTVTPASKTKARALAASSGASTASPPRLRQSRRRGSGLTVTQQLALDPGDNMIEVVAYNGSNLLASLPARMTINFTGRPTRQSRSCIFWPSASMPMWTGGPPAAGLRFAARPRGKGCQAFGGSMKRAAAGLYGEVRVTLALDKEATRDNLERIIDQGRARDPSARFLHPLCCRARHVRERPFLFHPAGLPERAGPSGPTCHRPGSPAGLARQPHQGQAGDHPARHLRVRRVGCWACALAYRCAGFRSGRRAAARGDRPPCAYRCCGWPVRP